ncbi:MAG: IS21 family transposase [Desulfotalea sp.]|nr:MAG: IS21 family transposase [Desulfotalea sp.]
MSRREAARQFGISRETVAKMLKFSVPPGYRRTAATKRPKLDGFTPIIDGYIEDDKLVPKKQRHTSKRIFERLRDEHDFTGGYTTIKDYVRGHHQRHKEVFVPLSHAPGQGQADFGEAQVILGGVQQKAYFFVLDLPHSDACYVRAYPRAVTEAWLDGHNHAFAFFGAVPQSIVYDNDRCLVARIMPDGIRKRTEAFSGFLSHYLIKDRYGRPGKGNDKGKVEGMVGYTRRNFMVPIPQFASFDAFNEYLEAQCLARQMDNVRGHKASIGDRLKADLAVMQTLPATPFDACHKQVGRVTSQSLVRYKGNDYSVPVAYGHRDVWIRGYVSEVVIGCKAEIIARHDRSYDTDDMIFNPLHYLPLIERKIASLDQAAPLDGWDLPEDLTKLRRLLEARMGKAGKREYVQVLRLLDIVDMNTLAAATRDALRLGAVGFDAIKHLVLCRIERRPAKLDLEIYPYLPKATVGTTSAASYMSLLGQTAGAPS